MDFAGIAEVKKDFHTSDEFSYRVVECECLFIKILLRELYCW